METWSGIDATNSHEEVLRKVFGFVVYKPGQREIIEAVLEGHDVFATLPTGSGKSLCFELPIAMTEKGTTAVVVSPLIALMRSQAERLSTRGIPVDHLHSGRSAEERGGILENLCKGRLAAIYLSPEQLQTDSFARASHDAKISRVVVDEAHCIARWGHDFRPEYLQIRSFLTRRDIGQVLAFTATASAATKREIREQLCLEDAHEFHGDIERPNLYYKVEKISDPKQRKKIIIKKLKEHAPESNDAVIIYCSTREDTEDLAKFLQSKGYPAEFYHAGLEDHERRDRENGFLNNGIQILVATNAFGMGMDKDNVRLIIHHKMPGSVDQYLQETGRAGRDGRPSHCVLIYHPDDRGIHDYFIREKCPKITFIKGIYDAIARQYSASQQKARGWFPLNRVALYKTFVGRTAKGNEKSLETAINAAIDFMIEHGILEEKAGYVKINAFPNNEDEGKLGKESEKRGRIATANLEQIIKYAQSPCADQRMLIDLLNTEA